MSSQQVLDGLAAAPTAPRRRRTMTCPLLRINGAPWSKADHLIAGKVMLRHANSAARTCLVRRGVEVERDYVDDVCTSSWARICPWVLP